MATLIAFQGDFSFALLDWIVRFVCVLHVRGGWSGSGGAAALGVGAFCCWSSIKEMQKKRLTEKNCGRFS